MTLGYDAITVRCAIDGCFARVYNDVRCSEHGGTPEYEWRESIWGGETIVRPKQSEPHPQEGQRETTTP